MAKTKTKPRNRVKGSASRGFFRRRKWIWIVPLVLLLIPAMQVAVVPVKGLASRRILILCSNVCYVYVLRSESDSGFYIGFSTDLKRRLAEHMRGASFATKSRGPWKLIYYEAYAERDDTEGREKFLKSGAGRRFLRSQLRHYLRRFPARVKGFASRGDGISIQAT